MTRAALLLLMLGACGQSAPTRARITADLSPPIDLVLTHVRAQESDGELVITWDSGADAGFEAPFFQIRGVSLVVEKQDPTLTEVAFAWPGAHDRPFLRACDCSGSIVVHVDEVRREGSIDLDLSVPFVFDGACERSCDVNWFTTDAGTVFVPPHPCDGGRCVDWVACPGESLEPIFVDADDAGQFTAPVRLCENPELRLATARVRAHATISR